MKEIKLYSNEGTCPFSNGDTSEIVKIHLQNVLKNYSTNLNQDGHKSFLGERVSSLLCSFLSQRRDKWLHSEFWVVTFKKKNLNQNAGTCLFGYKLPRRWGMWPMGLCGMKNYYEPIRYILFNLSDLITKLMITQFQFYVHVFIMQSTYMPC